MNQRLKKCILCAGAAALLAASPAMAAVNVPAATPANSQMETPDPGKEEQTTPGNILEILEEEGNKAGKIQTGEQLPEDGGGDWAALQ